MAGSPFVRWRAAAGRQWRVTGITRARPGTNTHNGHEAEAFVDAPRRIVGAHMQIGHCAGRAQWRPRAGPQSRPTPPRPSPVLAGDDIEDANGRSPSRMVTEAFGSGGSALTPAQRSKAWHHLGGSQLPTVRQSCRFFRAVATGARRRVQPAAILLFGHDDGLLRTPPKRVRVTR